MGSGPLWDFHAPPAFLCGIVMPVIGSKISNEALRMQRGHQGHIGPVPQLDHPCGLTSGTPRKAQAKKLPSR